MHRRIIVGHDGSSRADDGLAFAARIAVGSGARLTVAYIYHQEPAYESQDRHYRRDLRDRAGAVLRPALEKLPAAVEADSGAFPASTAADGLRELARAEEADTIVIGSTHHGSMGAVLIGSVGELLCTGSPCAVAVAPHGYEQGSQSPAARVGVAFDGSDESALAVRSAIALARAMGAELVALTASEKSRSPLRLTQRGREEKLRHRLGEVVAAEDDGVQVEHEFVTGAPAAALAEAARGLDALVVGSRGYGPVRHTLLGGVTGKLMRTAPCPLVIVPRGATPPGTGGEPARTARAG